MSFSHHSRLLCSLCFSHSRLLHSLSFSKPHQATVLTELFPRGRRFLGRDSGEVEKLVVVAVVLPLVEGVKEGLQSRRLSRPWSTISIYKQISYVAVGVFGCGGVGSGAVGGGGDDDVVVPVVVVCCRCFGCCLRTSRVQN